MDKMKEITSKTRLLGFFGSPSEHSKSPDMYNKAFKKYNLDYIYLSFNVKSDELKRAFDGLKALKMIGANISMPNKERSLEYMDELSMEAKILHAINTVKNYDGILKGYNTDVVGIKKAVENCSEDIKDRTYSILGFGGAGKAASFSLCKEGAEEVNIFVRSNNYNQYEKELEKLKRRYEKHIGIAFRASIFPLEEQNILREKINNSSVLINATDVGMGTKTDESLIDSFDFLDNKKLKVIDMIYEPEETKLLKLARKSGLYGMNGKEMLIFQGEEAFNIFTGIRAKF